MAIIENDTIVPILVATIPPEDVTLDKLPVSDGKGVLTSRLK